MLGRTPDTAAQGPGGQPLTGRSHPERAARGDEPLCREPAGSEPDRRLRRREELCLLLESLIVSLVDGVAVLDSRGDLVHLSDSLRDLRSMSGLALEPSSVPASSPSDSVPASSTTEPEPLPASVLAHLQRQARRLRAGVAGRFDLCWPHGSGGAREFKVTATAGPGRIEGGGRLVLFAFQDRTGERALERARSDHRALRHRLARMNDDLEDAHRLLVDLVEAGRPQRPSMETISLDSLLAESLADLRRQPGFRETEVDVHLDRDLLPCRADRRLLRWVLSRVYAATQEALGEGGTLSLRGRHGEGGVNASFVRVIVRGTAGMPPRDGGLPLRSEAAVSRERAYRRGLCLARCVIEALGGRTHGVRSPSGIAYIFDLPSAAARSASPAGREEEPVREIA